MSYRVPGYLANHPGVMDCASGIEGGAERRHDVILHDDWVFTWGALPDPDGGRAYDWTRTGFFDNRQQFEEARPMLLSDALAT